MEIINESLREILLAMRAEDVRVREELAATGELFDGYAAQMEQVHVKNAAALERMIEEYGWLGKSMVGEDGAKAAWLIVQHAISLPDFTRKCLVLIENAVADNEAEPYQAAFLHDRICFFENRPQRYGTQSDWDEGGKIRIWTLEDKEKVNDFRREVGLEPLESLILETFETGEHAPADFAKRQRDSENWARRVGWRR